MDSHDPSHNLRHRPGFVSQPTSPDPGPPSRPSSPSRSKLLQITPSLAPPSEPPAPPATPPPSQPNFSPFSFPILLVFALLVIPGIVNISSRSGGNYQVPAVAAKPRARFPSLSSDGLRSWNIGSKKSILWKKQTVADMSIPVEQYNWGGQGDGAIVCKRWSHQTALIGDELYIYGGQSTTNAEQKSNQWNSNLLTLSLRDNWVIGSPPVTALSGKEAGPPPVANGYLFSCITGSHGPTLYLYGGLVSDNPYVLPPPNTIWSYSINSKHWSEIKQSNFIISGDTEQKRIERAAEGAGISIPERGLGFYFGGHLDGYTTQGWDQSIPRIYLKSLLELRLPGGTQAKIPDGSVGFRNVSIGNGLDGAGVPERADGVLVFVPWGKQGLLVGIGGGRNETFSQLNIVDVYDLSSSKWYKQATSGPTPKYRVNACAVVANAPDGSSYNIYFYGGQNLVPYKEQIQYDDIWILSVPSFTWIQVDLNGQSNPPARAGHTCDIRGRQMVIVGGYVSTELSCDSPGIYVFDVTSLQWQTEWRGVGSGASTPSQDLGYKVPKLIYDLIGGNENGGANVNHPVRPPDGDSPLVTSNPTAYTYTRPGYTMTITRSDGSVVTQTGITVHDPPSPSPSGKNGPNMALIIGAIVGGIVALVLLIFLGLFILYKRKIRQLRERSKLIWEENIRRSGRRQTFDERTGTETSDDEDERRSTEELLEIMRGREPTFWGMILAPRRSLRVVNLS